MMQRTTHEWRAPNVKKSEELKNAVKRTACVILAGGRGSRLMGLTESRAKPAVPFGPGFRIIDFTLSNCINSGFTDLNVLTQYQSETLENYIGEGWDELRQHGGSVKALPPRPEMNAGEGYVGTADAVFQNIDALLEDDPEWVLVLAGDHIYKMDYAAMLAEHIRNKADATIPCIEVPRMEATAFGVMHVDAENRILHFLEKPKDPPGIPGKPDQALASMGIYIFNAKFLKDELTKDAADPKSEHDFGKNIIPSIVERARVFAHRFSDSCIGSPDGEAYWRDVGTVDAYWQANMDMTEASPVLDINDSNWPIFTSRKKPPVRLESGRLRDGNRIVDSLISDDSEVGRATIYKSLVSDKVSVATDANISETVLLPGVTVGRNARLKRAIVDLGCKIPDGLVVGEDADEDARRFYRTSDGVVLINQEMLRSLS